MRNRTPNSRWHGRFRFGDSRPDTGKVDEPHMARTTKGAPGTTQVVETPRRPQPFAFLDVERGLAVPAIDPKGRAFLMACSSEYVPALVRGLVTHTISEQNTRNRVRGAALPIQVSVLNRRRRAARQWIQSVLAADVSRPILHAAAYQWLPTMCGNSPIREVAVATCESCAEFVRGAVTALIFDRPGENLLGHARAMHVLEQVLATHVAAARRAVAARQVP